MGPPGSIVATSRGDRKAGGVRSVLLVGRSAGSMVSPLAARQRLVGMALGRRLAAAGVPVQALSISSVELDPRSVLEQAVRSRRPSHLMEINVPSGTGDARGDLPSAYVVQVELRDASTRAPVWRYSAQVRVGRQAQDADVASSIVERLRQDGLLDPPGGAKPAADPSAGTVRLDDGAPFA